MLQRDQGRCQHRGSLRDLQVHPILIRSRSLSGGRWEQNLITLRARRHNQAHLGMGETVLLAASMVCAIFGVLMTSFPTDHPARTSLLVTTLKGVRMPGPYLGLHNRAISSRKDRHLSQNERGTI
jgi:hypothetical protein